MIDFQLFLSGIFTTFSEILSHLRCFIMLCSFLHVFHGKFRTSIESDWKLIDFRLFLIFFLGYSSPFETYSKYLGTFTTFKISLFLSWDYSPLLLFIPFLRYSMIFSGTFTTFGWNWTVLPSPFIKILYKFQSIIISWEYSPPTENLLVFFGNILRFNTGTFTTYDWEDSPLSFIHIISK